MYLFFHILQQMLYEVAPSEAETQTPYYRQFIVRVARQDAPSAIFTRVDTNVVITGSRRVGDNFVQNLPRASAPLVRLRAFPAGLFSLSSTDVVNSRLAPRKLKPELSEIIFLTFLNGIE
jgi:hypothetical protein